MTDTCRSCGASIFWALTFKGKRMPIDSEMVPDGNIVVEDGVAYVQTADTAQLLAYKSHYATCPQADEWRKKT